MDGALLVQSPQQDLTDFSERLAAEPLKSTLATLVNGVPGRRGHATMGAPRGHQGPLEPLSKRWTGRRESRAALRPLEI
jgi:hypothetical protein